MTDIDERVVEMRFDNKQFESESKNTLNTLSKLKTALEFTDSGKEIDELGKKVSSIKLDGIAKGVEELSARFSTLGIVGMRVVTNLTDSVMGQLGRAVNYVKEGIVSGGVRRAMNIENAHFQLQALLGDEAKVQAIMDNAMEAVDGTAYAYDEAAKAASQFAASGLEAGDDMLQALKGITGVAAMTNSSFEDISIIFTQTAGQGRLMGDQLLQLSSRGMNAAATLADYFREVRGEAGMTEADIREMVSDGELSFNTFAQAMNWAFGDSAKRANETFNGAMSNMKSALSRIGAGFISPLIEQNGVLVDLFNTLRVKINDIKGVLVFDEERSSIEGLAEQMGISANRVEKIYNRISEAGHVTADDMARINKTGVKGYSVIAKYFNGVSDGSIRASYAITQVINGLTNGTKVGAKDIKQFVKDGKVNLDVFSAAIENTFGSQKQKVSKRFTDSLSKSLDVIRDTIEKIDFSKVAEYGVKSFNALSNVVKGLLSFIKPVGDAFAQVFLQTDIAGGAATIIDKIETLTASFKATDEQAEKIRTAFQGIFDVFGLVGTIIIDLIKSFTPFGSTIEVSGNSVLDLAAYVGELLSEFTKWVRTNPAIIRGYDALKRAVSTVSEGFKAGIKVVSGFTKTIADSKVVEKAWTFIKDLFDSLSEKFSETFDKIMPAIEDFKKSLEDLDETDVEEFLASVSQQLGALESQFNITGIIRDFNNNITTIVNNVQSLGDKANEASKEGGALSKFVDKIKEIAAAITDSLDPSLGGLLSGALGTGMIYGMLKIAKNLNAITSSITPLSSGVTKLFGSISQTLTVYQRDLKADALVKIAKAIIMLAGAMALLTLVDSKKLIVAVGAISAAGFILIKAADHMANGQEKLEDAMSSFTKSLSKSIKMKATADVFKKIGSAILSVAMSIAVVAHMYSKDDKSTTQAFGIISGVIVEFGALATAMTLVGRKIGDGKQFAMVAIGIRVIAGSVLTIVKALRTFCRITLPTDMNDRLKILAGILGGIGILAAAILAISGLSTRSKVPGIPGSTQNASVDVKKAAVASLGLAAAMHSIGTLLETTIKSLNKLFKMTFPTDYKKKFDIFKDMLTSIGVLAVVIEIFGKGGNGTQINTGFASILAICGLLYTATYALRKVMDLELSEDWVTKLGLFEALLLSVTFVTRSVIKASKNSNSAIKGAASIVALCLVLVTITGALSILAMIPFDKIGPAAVALGAVLLALGATFAGIGKIKDANAAKSVAAMATLIGVIAVALGVLSIVKFKPLMKAAVALDSVLMTLAATFVGVGKAGSTKGAAVKILAMIGLVSVIAGELLGMAYLVELGDMADSMVASAGSLSLLVLALAGAFRIISSAKYSKGDAKKVGTFIEMAIAVVPLAAGLRILKGMEWDTLLAGAAGLSLLVEACGLVFNQLSKTKISNDSEKKIAEFVAMTLALIPIAGALWIIADKPWDGLLAGATALSAVLLAMSVAFKVISNESWSNGDWKKFVAFGSIAAETLILMVPLAVLADYPWQGLIGAAASLGIVLASMAAAVLIISNAKAPKLSVVVEFVALCVTLCTIVDPIAELSQQPWASMLAAAAALSTVILSMSAAILLLNLSKTPKMRVVVEFVALCAALCGIVNPLVELSQMPMEQLLAAAASLSAVILAMTAAFGIITACGALGQAAKKGVEALIEFVVAFGALMTAFGALNKIPGFKDFINGGIDILCQVGEGIGRFISSIGKGLTSELPAIGANITAFAEQMSTIPSTAFDGAKACAEILLLFTGSEIISGISAFLPFTKSIDSLGAELVTFGGYIADFSEKIQNIKPAAVNAAANVGNMLANLYETLPNTGGLFEKFTGEQMSLSALGEELVAFAPDIVSFAEITANLTESSVAGGVAAAKCVASIYSALPREEGWVQAVIGEPGSLKTFADELCDLAPSLVEFATQTSNLTEEDVAGGVAAAELISGLYARLPRTGGTFQNIFGEATDLSSFGTQMSSLGTGIKNFVTATTNITEDSVSAAVAAAGVIAGIYDALPKEDGIIKNIFGGGQTDLSEFASQMEDLGDGIGAFAEKVANVTADSVSGALSVATTLSTVTTELSDVDVDAAHKVESFLNTYATAIVDYENAISQVNFDTVLGSTTNVDKVISSISALASGIEEEFVSGIDSAKQSAKRAVSSMFSDIVDILTKNETTFKTDGKKVAEALTKSFTDAINDGKDSMKSSITKLFSEISKLLNDQKDDYKKLGEGQATAYLDGFIDAVTSSTNMNNLYKSAVRLGEYYCEGLAKGLENKRNEVIAKAQSIADDADAIIASVWQEHSPSKLAEQRGEWYAQGMANGLDARRPAVIRSAKAIAKAADDIIASEWGDKSPSDAAIQRGKWLAEGLVIDIENSPDRKAESNESSTDDKAADKANKKLSSSRSGLKDFNKEVEQYAGNINAYFLKLADYVGMGRDRIVALQEEMEKQDKLDEKIAKKKEKREKKIQKLQDIYQKKKDKLDAKVDEQEEIEYNRLTMSDEEFKQWNKERKQDDKNHREARRRAEYKVYGSKGYGSTAEMAAEQTKGTQAYQNFLEIDEQYQNLLGKRADMYDKDTAMTTEFYSNLSKLIKSGNSSVLEEGMDLQEAEAAILDGILDVYDQYLDAYNQARDAAIKSLDPFSEATEDEIVDINTMFSNLDSQNDRTKRYIAAQESLKEAFADAPEAYEKFIATMGEEKTAQLEYLASLSPEELQALKDKFNESLETSSELANYETQDLKDGFAQQIADILGCSVQDINFDELIQAIATGGLEAVFGSKEAGSAGPIQETLTNGCEQVGKEAGKSLEEGIAESFDGRLKVPTKKIKKSINDSAKEVKKDGKKVAKEAGKEVAEAGNKGAKSTDQDYKKTGKQLGKSMADGFGSKKNDFSKAVKEVVTAGINSLKSGDPPPNQQFEDAGKKFGNKFVNGVSEKLKDKDQGLEAKLSIILKDALNFINTMKSQYKTAGAELGQAIADGLASKQGDITAAATPKTSSSGNKGNKNSKNISAVGGLMMQLARVAKNIPDNQNQPSRTTPVSFYDDPGFTPVKKVSLIDNGSIGRDISAIARSFTDSISVVRDNALSTMSTMNSASDIAEIVMTQSKAKSNGNSYVFNQYNTSPKALSAIDIYRNTNNQFARFRKVVESK